MAGHSKWANIQHRKGAQDKKKAKIFSKLSKEITIAAKMGGGDPDMNPRLRLAIANAKGQSMPKDNIQRAIDKAVGGDVDAYEDIRYEGFASGGVGIIVECSTDNKNRSGSDVRTAFSKNGGNLGETGSVSFGFDQVGEIVFPAEAGSEDAIMEAAIEAGAEDVVTEEDVHLIYTAREDLMEVAGNLEGKFGDIEPSSTALIWKPQNLIECDEDAAAKVLKMVEALEDLDDVQNVYGNYDIPDEVMEKLAED
ncbi:MAG: YebC/PmpR family DNA-binding transcriptional regulator [Hirschia sp.]|nr:YebC/PmpR family DNA-binding transcriptional regulator [Hirschia sp.]MBF18929.1 YebC/PmpR family DNA-binding transcriptional regulator [Hirschia sp.]MBF20290.1 YebC/PmpR family DNA-binding transcriptional regulator [Hirschia sp.]